MDKKITLWLSIFVLALAVLATPVAADVNPKLRLDSFTLSPALAAPGQTITLAISLKDIADVCAEKVSAQVTAAFPLSVQGPDSQYIETLCQKGNFTDGSASFKVYVDPLAVEGSYQLALATTYQKSFLTYAESNPITVRVQGTPQLDAFVVASTPQDAYPGDDATITIRIDNTGTAPVTSATATLSSPSLEVKWAGATQQLGQINARSSAQAQFTVEAPKNLPAGTYPLKLKVDFVQLDGTIATKQFSFNMPVKPKAEFSAADADGTPITIGESRLKQLNLTNTGSQAAVKLKAVIKPVYPFTTDGTIRYVESIAPGETKTLDYTLSSDKQANEGTQVLSLTLNWEDQAGKQFTQTIDFPLKTTPKTLLQTLTEMWYFGAIIIIIAVVMVFKRKKKQ